MTRQLIERQKIGNDYYYSRHGETIRGQEQLDYLFSCNSCRRGAVC